MGACPFCGGDVAEDVLLNGGHCPHCLIEIPGEDTPTDPGEQAKAMQEAEAKAEAATKQSKSFIAIAAVAVLALGGAGAFFALQPDEPVGELASDEDMEFSFAPASSHKDLPVGEQPSDEATAKAGGSGSRKAPRSGGGSAGRSDAVAKSGQGGSASASAGAPEASPPVGGSVPSTASGGGQPDVAKAELAADPLAAFGMGGGPASKGPQAIVLSEPGEIYDMVKKVLKVNARQMTQCYNQRLKVKEDLSGAWTASFTIMENGTTSAVVVKGEGVADAELESCMKAKVEKWTFQAISEAFRIDKTFTFRR